MVSSVVLTAADYQAYPAVNQFYREIPESKAFVEKERRVYQWEGKIRSLRVLTAAVDLGAFHLIARVARVAVGALIPFSTMALMTLGVGFALRSVLTYAKSEVEQDYTLDLMGLTTLALPLLACIHREDVVLVSMVLAPLVTCLVDWVSYRVEREPFLSELQPPTAGSYPPKVKGILTDPFENPGACLGKSFPGLFRDAREVQQAHEDKTEKIICDFIRSKDRKSLQAWLNTRLELYKVDLAALQLIKQLQGSP